MLQCSAHVEKWCLTLLVAGCGRLAFSERTDAQNPDVIDPDAAKSYASTILADRPVGYWRLGESSGLVARDSSGNGFDGAYQGGVTLDTPGALAWNLRRFERDLLAHLGYGLQLTHDVDTGAAIDPEREYHYVPEHGPRPLGHARPAGCCRGAALLALERDVAPAAAGDLAALRLLMRSILRHHLGGRDLEAWRVLA